MKIRKYFLIIASFAICSSLFSCQKAEDGSPQSSENNYSQQAVGKSAHDLLSSDKFTTLEVEVLYGSLEPDAAALNMVKQFLENRLNKPSGISLTVRQITASGKTTLSLNDIESIEKQYRKKDTKGDKIAVCVIYANADYTNDNVLGIAYRNTSVCLFGKTIDAHSGDIGQASTTKLTATVLEHEFGHLLGLVNNGSAMQTDHEDDNHSHHCNNENCLMYYAAETTDILGFLLTGDVPNLDANCLADLKANGGK